VSELALGELLEQLLDRVCEALTGDTVAILLLDANSNELVARAATGIEEEVEQGTARPQRSSERAESGPPLRLVLERLVAGPVPNGLRGDLETLEHAERVVRGETTARSWRRQRPYP
jgi:hypothetical protein